jgi:hypothetical protein
MLLGEPDWYRDGLVLLLDYGLQGWTLGLFQELVEHGDSLVERLA